MQYPLFSENPYLEFRLRIQSFVQTHIRPYADTWESRRYFPVELLKKSADCGFIGLSIPIQKGGQGLSFWHEVIVAEELACAGTLGWPLSYMVHTQVIMPILAEIGSDFILESVVKPGLKGEFYTGLAVTETVSGSDIEAIKTTAYSFQGNLKITGSKKYISNGSVAQYLLTLVTFKGNKKPKFGLVLIPNKSAKVRCIKIETNGLKTGDLGEIHFNNTNISREYLIGKPPYALYNIFKAIQKERLVGAVALNSLSTYILDKTVKFLKQRSRFGSPLSKLQSIRYQLVSLYAQTESIKQFTYRVCEDYNNNKAVDDEILMLKILAFEHCQKLIQECGHLHGAKFFIQGHWLWNLYEDSQAFTLAGGTTELIKHMLAELKQF